MTVISENIAIPADHPSLPGHFPGEPMVPGALLLDEILSLAERRGAWVVENVIAMKFSKPLDPEVRFTIQLAAPQNSIVEFVCTIGDEVLASGRLGISSIPGA